MIFTHIHYVKHTHPPSTPTHTHTDTWEGELWTKLKEVCQQTRNNEQPVRVMLLDRAFHWERPYVSKLTGHVARFESLDPGTPRNDSLANKREHDGMHSGMNSKTQSGRFSWTEQ